MNCTEQKKRVNEKKSAAVNIKWRKEQRLHGRKKTSITETSSWKRHSSLSNTIKYLED